MAHPHAVSPPDPLDRLVGQSPAVHALRTQIRHLVGFDAVGNPQVPTVLLQGETGTGKGLVARIIHDSGPRALNPFIEVNCAAIPDALLEAELFGFEAGAFSDAKRAKPGLFEAASKGTLFLDEIDALPLVLQGKLLTAIEAKRVRRLGAVVERAVDVKLIAATQTELRELVRVGRFRADLYHRLAVVVLALPPLRDRGVDGLVLAQSFMQRYAVAHGVRPKRLTPAAEVWLQGYAWPGNVRELSHLLERVMLLHPADIIDPQTLERLCLPQLPTSSELVPLEEDDESRDEASRIRQALQQTGGKVVPAARLLGLSRGTLRYRMSHYGLRARSAAERSTRDSTRSRGPSRPPEDAMAEPRREGALVPPPTGEQKPVVVLAIDLSFPITAEAEPWHYEPRTVTRRWEQTIGEKVQGVGGVLLPRAGPLLLAAFGLPRTLEQLPQRAIQAALAIRQLAAQAQAGGGWEPVPEVRQALHLGPLLVQGAAGKVAPSPVAVGDTLAVPVRLLGQAAPGEVLISPPLARLVAGWCALEARAGPPGASHPGQAGAYYVDGLVPRRSPLAGLGARTLSPLVGRERELAVLAEILAQVEGGWGQVVGIVGEPGIGKSRLLYEFRQRLAGRQVTYLGGQCLSYGSTIPYLSVRDLLRDNCGITEGDEAEAIAEKVRFALHEVGMDPDEGAPYLLQILGIQRGAERLAGLRPETLKDRSFETLRQLSLHGSRQQPLILAVEDVQWIDQTSTEFFCSIVDRLAGVPILLLTTYRPGYRPPWGGKSYETQLVLRPLTSEDSLGVALAALQTEQIPAPLAQILLANAGGNPLFLEELVQVLREQGLVVQTPGGRAMLAEPLLTSLLSEIQLPPTIQGVLMARLDRLAPEVKGLLHILAVIGRTCSSRLLSRVAEQPRDALQPLLASLQAAEFLYERPGFPEPEYTIKHALTQEVAYASLPSGRRRELHERTAQAIEALFGHRLEEHASELAHHYSRSGDTAKAFDYLRRAGQYAMQRSAHAEAISHLSTGLVWLKRLPDTPERLQQELDIQILLGPALMATQGYAAPEVERAYARARELCLEVGETPQLFSALRGLWSFYVTRGELEVAYELGEQLLHMAQQVREPALLLEAYQALGLTLVHLGELAPARVHLEQGIALYDPQHHHSHTVRFAQDPGVICLGYLSEVLWYLGYPDQALHRSQEALALARELAHPFSLAFAWNFAGALYYLLRDGPAVQERAEAAIALASEQGFILWRLQGKVLQGWGLAEQGWGEEGIAQMCEGLAAWRAIGAELGRPYYLGLLAEAYAKMGQTEAGLRALAEALAAMHKYGERFCEAELYRLKGELLLEGARDQHAEVQDCFERALNVARHQQAKSLELRAAMSLSRLWQHQGKRKEAKQLLVPIYDCFIEGFETADLQEAKALLETLS